MFQLYDNDIIGFETDEGIYCPTCWESMFRAVDDEAAILVAEDIDGLDEPAYCDRCGGVLGELQEEAF